MGVYRPHGYDLRRSQAVSAGDAPHHHWDTAQAQLSNSPGNLIARTSPDLEFILSGIAKDDEVDATAGESHQQDEPRDRG